MRRRVRSGEERRQARSSRGRADPNCSCTNTRAAPRCGLRGRSWGRPAPAGERFSAEGSPGGAGGDLERVRGFSDIDVGFYGVEYTRIEVLAFPGGEVRGSGGGWRRKRRYGRCCSSASSWSPSVPRLHARSSGRVPCPPVERDSWTLHKCMQQPRNYTTHGAFKQSRIAAPNATASSVLLLFFFGFPSFFFLLAPVLTRPWRGSATRKSHRNSNSHSSSQKKKRRGSE